MEEWKTMHGRWEEGIHHLEGTKHQVHVGFGEEHLLAIVYIEIKISLPFSF
jgi:hypothetical protein